MRKLTLLLILLLVMEVPVTGSAAPSIRAVKTDNKISLSILDIPSNITSLQMDITFNKSITSAEMSWSKLFDFRAIKNTDNATGTKITIYIDELTPLTANGRIDIGQLTITGLQEGTVISSTGYLKLINTSLNELTYNNTAFSLSNNTTGGVISPPPTTAPTPSPTPTPSQSNSNEGNLTYSSDTNIIQQVYTTGNVVTVKTNSPKLIDEISKSNYPMLDLSNQSGVNVMLSGSVVSTLMDSGKTLEIITKNLSYNLDPKRLITTANLKDGETSVEIAEVSKLPGGFNTIVTPVSVKITHTYQNKTTEIKKFKAFSPAVISYTGARTNHRVGRILADGTLAPMPGVIESDKNARLAVFNSMFTGAFALVEETAVDLKGMANHWAARDISAFAARDIITRLGDFSPDEKITRGEFLEIVIRSLGLYDIAGGKNPFTDVYAGNKYKNSIAIGKEYNIVSGNTDGTFKPDSQITREEAAKIICNAFRQIGIVLEEGNGQSTLAAFKDRAQIGSWVVVDFETLVQNKVFSGDDKGYLNPKGNITKAETVSVMARILRSVGLGG